MSIVWLAAEDGVLTPPATQYGYVLDHLYAVNGETGEMGEMGSNIARRQKWVEGMYLYARAFTAREIEAQDTDNPLPYGVFIVGVEVEYNSPAEDMSATDWQMAVRT